MKKTNIIIILTYLISFILLLYSIFIYFIVISEYSQIFSKCQIEIVRPYTLYYLIINSWFWKYSAVFLYAVYFFFSLIYNKKINFQKFVNLTLIYLICLLINILVNLVMLYALFRYKTHLLGS